MKLEELARQSSGAARAAVAHLDPPALGADARNRGRTPVLLGAAAVLLIVGLGAYLLSRDDATETVSAGSVEVPVLGLADPASFGLTATGMFDPERMAEEFGVENPEVTFVYFGTPGADDPFANGDMLVGELRNETPEPLGDGAPLTVRGGLEASALDPSSDAALPGRNTIEWYEPSSDGVVQMVIASATLDVDELAAVVEHLDLSAGIAEVSLGDDATLPESARGLAAVAVEDDYPLVFGGFRALTSTVVAYQRAPELSADFVRSVSVASRAETISDSIVPDRWWADTTEAIAVNGTAGWRFTYAFDDGTSTQNHSTESIVWQWDTGVVASVTVTASSGARSALELAEAVVELDPATVDRIGDADLADQAAADFDEVWGSGSGESPLPDGSTARWSWAIGTQGDQFCTSFASGSSGSSSCQPFSQVLNLASQAPAVIDQSITEDLQMGVIVAGADDMVVPAAETPGDLAEVVVPDDADGTRLLVWVGPADAPARFDVVVGGEVVEALDLADGTAAIEEGELAPSAGESEETVDEEADGVEIDVASNPSAQSLGIADGFAVEATGGNGRISWVVGTYEGESYMVADGEATFAALLPDDVTVLKPIELSDGILWTYVVARDVPSCVSLRGVSVVTASQPDETTAGPELIVWPLEGTADGWRLVFDRSGEDVRMQLPDIEGSTSWPETFCGDTAEPADAAVSLADLDPGTLSAMAADGLLVDGITLPPGFEYEGSSGDDSRRSHLFTSVVPRDISIGWQLGEEPTIETTPDSIRSQQLTLETPMGRRSVSTREYGPPGLGQVRVTYPVNGRRIVVTGSDVAVDLLLDVMTELVVVDPVYDSDATPSLAEAQAALDGLAFTDALRVATEAGWQIRVSILNGEEQESEADERFNRVNVSYTDGSGITVVSVG